MEATQQIPASRSRLGVVALVCSAIGAPFCLYLFLYYLADSGQSDRFFQLMSQNAHEGVRRALDMSSLAGLLLALVGAVLGGIVLVVSKRRGARSRSARFAFYLGLIGLALFVAGILAELITFASWSGPA